MIFKLLFAKDWVVIISNTLNYEIDYNDRIKYPKQGRADVMTNLLFRNTIFISRFLHYIADNLEYKLNHPEDYELF